jgi:hypothetical protein
MDIKDLMQKMHKANTDEERDLIKSEIENQFSSLSDSEKEEVRKAFTNSWDEKIIETKELLDKVDVYIEMSEISKYVSLSVIARDYFGKSKEWLYQRIKGYKINGKQAQFTDEERKRLSEALKDLSKKLNDTSLNLSKGLA